jgi:hypothetical protein
VSRDHAPGNPVTAHLLSQIEDPSLRSFTVAWDSLEWMAIEAYRNQSQDRGSEERYLELRTEILKVYPHWESEFVLHSEAGSKPEGELNPFRRILAVTTLQGLWEAWDLMRCFPQARETLNLYLIDRLHQSLEEADA